MKVEVRLTGVDNVLNMLKQLPPEVVSKRGGPVRRALRKGAVVIRDQERANLKAVTANATEEGRRYSTGLLSDNLVIRRGRPPAGVKGEAYIVTPKRGVFYPERNQRVSIIKAGSLLEYGSSQQPAEPWARPAVEQKGRQAIDVVTTELVKDIDRISKRRLAKGR